MSKSMDRKKEAKKKPAKSLQEKRELRGGRRNKAEGFSSELSPRVPFAAAIARRPRGWRFLRPGTTRGRLQRRGAEVCCSIVDRADWTQPHNLCRVCAAYRPQVLGQHPGAFDLPSP
jgi:hypothetical protein